MAAKAQHAILTLLGRIGTDIDAGATTLAAYQDLGAERTIA